MDDFKFGNIDTLKRNRAIEGESGTETALGNSGITLTLLAATDANPRWKAFGADFRAGLNRLTRARAPEDKVKPYMAEWYTRLFVTDWTGVVDSDGTTVPFGAEACQALLMQADDAIPTITAVVYDTGNFRGARIQTIVDGLKH